MKKMRFPIRIKFLMTFLVLVTVVVGLIVFSTASLFQDDKEAYVNGLTSMVALGAAEEARTLMIGYRERMSLYARLVLETDRTETQREKLAQRLFDEFPELIGLTLEDARGESASLYDVAHLDAVELSRDDLEAFVADNPLPARERLVERPFVRNATFSEKLPSFMLAFVQPVEGEDDGVVVSGWLESDRLTRLTQRFSAYEKLLTDSEENILVHSRPALALAGSPASLQPEASRVHNAFNAAVTQEYAVDGRETIGGFAAVDFGEMVSVAEIPRSAAHLASRGLVQRLLILAGLLLGLAIVLGIFWAHRITRPMEQLSKATRSIARGGFDIEVKLDTRDEMGDLATSFNQMAVELKQREEALEQTHSQLLQSEKMAAFGSLGAGIAHEVKNPLAGILACAQLAADDVEPESELHEDLRLIEKESMRCKEIIENLLKFARQEKAEMSPTQVNAVIEDSTAIVNHQLELHEIRVSAELQGDLPPVLGNANQLQQVFINLLINAQQAMEDRKGTVRITSMFNASGHVELRFADDGPGIPEEVRSKLFEPFFTTKPSGKGTGLGLSVSFGIIADHNGVIDVESEVGRGTTFIIRLPAMAATQPSENENATVERAGVPG